jgi:hypothetical protein
MRTSRKLTHALFSLFALVMMSAAALAADPGQGYPRESEVSDQKAGSVLFYNIYSSVVATPAVENTRINITNTSSTHAAFVHMYFVQDTCGVADAFICLTANQTATFLASDLDPGIQGYIIAVTVDAELGCPMSFNFLIGDLYIKAGPPTGSTGSLAANLAAEAFSALADTFTKMGNCNDQSATASLIFDGTNGRYNRAPLVLAVSNIPSPVDNNFTLLIVNRFGGNLATTANTIVRLFGLLYDDAENVFSFTIGTGACQFRTIIGANNIPRTTPRVAGIIPSGRSGWMKIWNADNASGLSGAVINVNGTAVANAFNGGHNLHKLTLSPTNTYTVPVFPPSC